MKPRFLSFLAIAATAGALTFLTGCETQTAGLGRTAYDPVAYKPHNPNAVRVKVSLSKQVVYVFEGSKPLLVAATNVGIPGGHATPTGNFTIEEKIAHKRSGSYGFYKNGDVVVAADRGKGHGEYIGYPMGFWCGFKSGYGFHQGYVWPIPRTHGCLRLHKTVAPKFYALVHQGTPVNIAQTQPEDATIGANVQRPTDYQDPDPPASFTASDRVFASAPGGGLTPY